MKKRGETFLGSVYSQSEATKMTNISQYNILYSIAKVGGDNPSENRVWPCKILFYWYVISIPQHYSQSNVTRYLWGPVASHLIQALPVTVQLIVPEYSVPDSLLLHDAEAEMSMREWSRIMATTTVESWLF